MKKLYLLLLFLAGAAWGQSSPDCSFTLVFTAAAAQSPAYNNKPSTAGGLPCTSWIVSYFTNGASSVSVQIEGSADSGGSPSGGYTLLTAATSPITSANPATGTTGGNILACCDYYPWIRINPTTFTGTNKTMTVRVYGYRGTSQVASGGGGGGSGITQLHGDVTAGPGTGNVAATVVGIETVPFCSGYAPTNGQMVEYTTGGSPNPCYSAAAGGSGATQVIGTASFNGVGSITSLVTAGVVSGVTYNSTGNYTVSISPSTSNYLVFVQCSNDSGTFVGLPSIIYNSVGGTSFGINIIQVNGGGFSNHDFPINYVSVVKY